MSNMAQARLLILKCLPSKTRHCNYNHHHVTLRKYQTAVAAASGLLYPSDEKLYDSPPLQSHFHGANKSLITSIAKIRKTRYLNSIDELVGELSSRRPVKSTPHENSLSICSASTRWSNPEIFPFSKCHYGVETSPLKVNHEAHENHTFNFDPLEFRNQQTCYPCRDPKLKSSLENHDRQYGRYKNNGRRYKSRCYWPVLGLMSMFKSKPDSDTQEQNSKLTDEEKIKRMKPIELCIAKGVLAMTDQEHRQANDFFHQALHIAQDESDEENEFLILNLLAANFFESGDGENAEKLFIDLIKRLISRDIEPTDPAILELSLKLASIYSQNKETHGKAMKGFKFVLNSLLNILGDVVDRIEECEINELSDERKNELALLGWSYDWFAKHLIVINDYGGATEMLKGALQISSKVLGPLHDQTLILLNDVGTTLAMNNSPAEGREFIKKAVEGAVNTQSKELASFYVNLGLVDLKLNNLDDAEKSCEYSIKLAKNNKEHHNSQEVINVSQNCLKEIKLARNVINSAK